MKVAINACNGVFSLSPEAYEYLGLKWDGHGFTFDKSNRQDTALIECIEALGSELASGRLAKLKIVEIPDGIEYEIFDYCGMESIHEKHRSWS